MLAEEALAGTAGDGLGGEQEDLVLRLFQRGFAMFGADSEALRGHEFRFDANEVE